MRDQHRLTTIDLSDGRQITTRSALEARWAIFFTELGLEWQYEPKRFEIKGGRYTPDFEVTDLGFIEIKPTLSLFISESSDKVKRFSLENPKFQTYIFCSEIVSFDCVALYVNRVIYRLNFNRMVGSIAAIRDSSGQATTEIHTATVQGAMRKANQSKLSHMVSVGKILSLEMPSLLR